MPTDDVLSALLPSLLGGADSGGGTDAGALGAMKAFQGSEFLQGVPSQSGPIGQISQAVMPLIAAKIYGEQAQRQQQAEKVKTLVSVLSLVRELKGADLSDKKTQMELEKLGIERDMLKHFQGLHDAVNGDELPAGTSMSIGGMHIPLGPPKENYNMNAITADAFREKYGRPPTRSELERAVQQREVEKQSAVIAAANQATLDTLRARGIKVGEEAAASPTPFTVEPPKGMNPEEMDSLIQGLQNEGKDVGSELIKKFGSAEPAPSPELAESRGTYEPQSVSVTGGKLGVRLGRPKSSEEGKSIVAKTQAIAGMRPKVEKVLNETPDISNIGLEAYKYVLPGELAAHPSLTKSLEMSALGSPNPGLTRYFETIGQLNFAMTGLASRLSSKSGSARMAVLLQPHIPQLAKQPSENKKILGELFGPDSVLIQEFLPEGRKAVRSGDLAPSEFGDVLKSFDIIDSVFKQGNKLYGVNSNREVIPLE